MIIADDASERPPSPSHKSSSSRPHAPSTLSTSSAGPVQRQPSPGPAPPSYSVATSEGASSPLTPLIPRPFYERPQRNDPLVMERGYYDQTLLAAAEQRERELARRTRKRFLRALLYACIIYILLGAFVGSMSPSFSTGRKNPWLDDDDVPSDPETPDDIPSLPNPSRPRPPSSKPWPERTDGDIVECYGGDSWRDEQSLYEGMILVSGPSDGSEYPFTVYNDFSLPVDAPSLSVFTRGTHASGRTLTTRDADPSKDIRLAIDIAIPKGADATRVIESFTLAFSWFSLSLDTGDDVRFNQITAVSSSDKIESKGLLATQAVITSSNGPVSGSLNVTRELVVSTSNAKIDVDINVFDNEDEPKHPSVTLSTSNGGIFTRNALYRDHESDKGGAYEIVASTKNAQINMNFTTAPIDSTLMLTTSTSNAGSEIHLHPTYEGGLLLSTSNGEARVEIKDDTKDPSGEGRERQLHLDSVWKGLVIGWVGWGEKKKRGDLAAHTSNGRNIVYV
ncbi:SubName: Full=Uncharacterized protein {ECO:0000313/EMBL:CCA73776.1} [Serendipita indica DSM 11827]|nr:SubName: Full=Uncharacterized protein {ECO:0000313/EMBL:CCA73776.1} [Serendipita indica DSM 11827]